MSYRLCFGANTNPLLNFILIQLKMISSQAMASQSSHLSAQKIELPFLLMDYLENGLFSGFHTVSVVPANTMMRSPIS